MRAALASGDVREEPRRVTRRAPPPHVGHAFFLPMQGFFREANYPHQPAIELALHHPAIGEIPYTLMAVTVPLEELLATFLDDVQLPRDEDQYALEWNGRRLRGEDTPQSLGIDPSIEWPAAVFDVIQLGSKRTIRALRTLNRLGAAMRIDHGRSGLAAQPAHLAKPESVDALSQIFSYVDFDDLVTLSSTSVLFHHISQRVSLLYQLQCSAPPAIEYPAYLKILEELSTRLDMAACRARSANTSRWGSLGLCKESTSSTQRDSPDAWIKGSCLDESQSQWDRPYRFTKAANCTLMRTVEAVTPLEELRQQTLPLRGAHTRFLHSAEPTVANAAATPDIAMSSSAAGAGSKWHSSGMATRSTKAKSADESEFMREVEGLARKLHDGSIVARTAYVVRGASHRWPVGTADAAETVNPFPIVVTQAGAALRRNSIDLFRQYFSPSMRLIFPLIAHQQSVRGLDFTSTHTWGVQLGKVDVGAVAWRIREPLLTAHARDADRLPVSTLEVLFIAVWEQYRHSECGRALVEALEVHAVDAGCRLMYVEVGYEQPLARSFWRKRGFVTTKEAGVSIEQSVFFESACLRFGDTEQYVKRVGSTLLTG